MATTSDEFVRHLTRSHRVIVLGGLAVIAHGLSRATMDADIWLDPMDSPETWTNALAGACRSFPHVTMHGLPGWRKINEKEIPEVAEATGMVRLRGLNCPIDIFRRPNEYVEDAFEEVFNRATRNDDGTWLPDPLDLLQSKLDTGREKDRQDMLHLEGVVRARYIEALPTATAAEAAAMLDRFSEWQVLRAALANPDAAVRDLANEHLREFAQAGDPFSRAILDGREIPG